MEPRVDQADVSGGFPHKKLQSSPVHYVGAMHSVALDSSSQSNDPMPLPRDDRSYTPFETNDEVSQPNDHINNESKLSKLSRIRSLRHKTKAKTKKLLKLDHEHDTHESANEEAGEEDGILDNVEGNPAFNPDFLVQKQPRTVGETADKAVGSIGGAIRSAAAAVAHPRSTAKSKATRTTASQLSKVERPYLSQEADAKFLRAHDELHRADLSRGNMEDEDAEAKADASKDKVGELEKNRESTRVAWITSRHVYRVRVVPNLHLKYPKRSEFEKNGPDGTEYHYGKWLGHLVIYYTQDFARQYIDDFNEPPFDIDSFRYAVERLIMASGPWQEWLMQVRMIYRWENPPKTAKWLVVYLVLWYTQHMMAFFYGYVLYTVVRNYYFPTDVKALRKSIERASDRRSTAYQFGEMIDKHGRDEWLQPMIDTVGPFAQLQIGDFANLLEVLYNFYTWKAPKKTASTLFFFFACLLVTLLTDMVFCMKIFWFICGASFFLCWPISSCYPKYRYLVSPTKWILWGIPTHAEWSFEYLRYQSQISREKMIGQKIERVTAVTKSYNGHVEIPSVVDVGPLERHDTEGAISSSDDDDWHSVRSSASILEGSDIKSYRCRYHGIPGRLIFYFAGLRFVRSLPSKKQLWTRQYTELVEMRKLQGTKIGKVAKLEQLELTFTDDETVTIQSLKDRDEVFNMIVGFSGLKWQALQTAPGPGKTGDGHSSSATPW